MKKPKTKKDDSKDGILVVITTGTISDGVLQEAAENGWNKIIVVSRGSKKNSAMRFFGPFYPFF